MDRCGGLGDRRRNWILDQWRHADRRPGSKSSAQAAHVIAAAGGNRRRELLWALDLHTTIGINMAGFITGGLIKDTGPAGNVALYNAGVTYRF